MYFILLHEAPIIFTNSAGQTSLLNSTLFIKESTLASQERLLVLKRSYKGIPCNFLNDMFVEKKVLAKISRVYGDIDLTNTKIFLEIPNIENPEHPLFVVPKILLGEKGELKVDVNDLTNEEKETYAELLK